MVCKNPAQTTTRSAADRSGAMEAHGVSAPLPRHCPYCGCFVTKSGVCNHTRCPGKILLPGQTQEILRAISDAGGKVLLIGGAVRDWMFDRRPPKDLDFEVYNLSAEQLGETLGQFGDADLVGVSFGVIKLRAGEYDYDFTLPRTESRTGAGHRDYEVEVIPDLSPREAAERRDYTWNAMALDVQTGELLDFYGGLQDLRDGVARATSPKFADDALRVMRGVQFCGRYDLHGTPETLKMCQQLRPDYPALALDRVRDEWLKWAEKSVAPSAGLRFLDESGWLALYPVLERMQGCKQDPSFHPEGDTWQHTLATTDDMARICKREDVPAKQQGVLMLAALLHDGGKPDTTEFNEEKGQLTSYNHPRAGAPLAAQFLADIGMPQKTIERVVPLVREHMRHVNYFTSGEVTERAARRLARDLAPATVQEWAWVVEADQGGRPPLPGGLPEAAAQMVEMAERARVKDAAPKCPLMGRHLIQMGLQPGKHFGDILRAAADAHIEGDFADVDAGKLWAEKYVKEANVSAI